MSSPETLRTTESNAEVQTAASERAEQLKHRFEQAGEHSPEAAAEQAAHARQETREIFAKEAGKERAGHEPVSTGAIHKATKADKLANYKHTMTTIRSGMSTPSKTFSKVIHTPFIERSSDILGSSLARPNAVLAGSFSALLLVSAMYVTARTFGYQLSGFETIGAFVIGWLLGIVFDYLKMLITGK